MECKNNDLNEIIDKVALFLSKKIGKYNNLSFKILEKNSKIINYEITIENEDNNLTKKYTKRLIPYERKKEINENSLKNLRYKNKNNNPIINNNFEIDLKENNITNNILLVDKKISNIDIVNNDDSIFKNNEKIINIYEEDKNNISNNKENGNFKHNEEQNNNEEYINIDETKMDICDKCSLFKNFIKGINNDYLEKINNMYTFTTFLNNNIEGLINMEKEQYKIFYNKILEMNKKKCEINDIIDYINIYNKIKENFNDKINVICKESNTYTLCDYESIKKYNNDILLEMNN